jgi:hypothetical protein
MTHKQNLIDKKLLKDDGYWIWVIKILFSMNERLIEKVCSIEDGALVLVHLPMPFNLCTMVINYKEHIYKKLTL